MLRDELKSICARACENEFDYIYKKYGSKFADDEPFVEVEQEEMDEVKSALHEVRLNWIDAKIHLMGKQPVSTDLMSMQNNIINTMGELAQCYAVIQRLVIDPSNLLTKDKEGK